MSPFFGYSSLLRFVLVEDASSINPKIGILLSEPELDVEFSDLEEGLSRTSESVLIR
jgi:hypothetical protein